MPIKLSTDMIIDIVILALVFFAGYHIKSMVDKIEADKIYQAQEEANEKKLNDLNVKSKQLETDLAAEREKSVNLDKQWSESRAKKTHTKCTLDDGTIGLLRNATTK